MSSRTLLLVACILALFLHISAALDAELESDSAKINCGDKTQAVGNCSVHFHVCGGFHKWHWKYSADATDTKSGKSGHSSDFSSKDGAAKQAAVALFQALGEGDCSCTVSTVPVGKCPIRFSVCFMLNNTGCLDNKQPSFNAWAFNTLSTHEASVHQYNDPKQAATDALTALFVASPADKMQCFPPPTEWTDNAFEASMVDIPSLF